VDRGTGFYDPAEEAGTEQTNDSIDYAELFATITDRTGWTPSQISSMTLRQFRLYIKAWSKRNKDDETMNPDFDEIRNFNLSAGIERIRRKI